MKIVYFTLILFLSNSVYALTCKPETDNHKKYIEQRGWDEIEINSPNTPLELLGKVSDQGKFYLIDTMQKKYPMDLEASLSIDKSHPDFKDFESFCNDPKKMKYGNLLVVIPKDENGPLKMSLKFQWAPEFPADIQFDWSQFELSYHKLSVDVSADALVRNESSILVGPNFIDAYKIINEGILDQLNTAGPSNIYEIDITNHSTYACDLLQGRIKINLITKLNNKGEGAMKMRPTMSLDFVNSLYNSYKKAGQLVPENYRFAAGFFGHSKLLEIDPENKMFYARTYAETVFKKTLNGAGSAPLNLSAAQISCLKDNEQVYEPEFVEAVYNLNLTFDKNKVFKK